MILLPARRHFLVPANHGFRCTSPVAALLWCAVMPLFFCTPAPRFGAAAHHSTVTASTQRHATMQDPPSYTDHHPAGRPAVRSGKKISHGKATYYARKFHGRKTASGERYDSLALTAAHRTLPFGTLVTVTSKKNGSSVTVRINDRGPVSKKRLIDLSAAAAKKLDMIRDGVVDVSIEIAGE